MVAIKRVLQVLKPSWPVLLCVCILAGRASAWSEKAVPEKAKPMETLQLKAVLTRTEDYPVDLTTILKLVDQQNLLIAQTRIDVKITRNIMFQRAATLLPSVEGSLVQSRLDGATQVFGCDVFRVVRNTVQPQVAASMLVHPGGKALYEILAARQRQQVAKVQLQETYQQQLARAAEEYYRFLTAQLKRDAVLKGMTEIQEQVNLNQARFKVGKGTYLEVMQARTSLARQKRLLKEADSAIVLAEQALLNRLNLDPEIHLVSTEADTALRSLVKENASLGELISKALSTHPAIQRFQDELKALGLDYKVIRAELIPSVTLRTYLNGTGPTWDNLSRSNFAGFTVNMNLLQNLGLQIPLRMQEKRQEIEKKVLAGKAVVRDVQSQVTTAYLNSQNYAEAISAAREELASAEEAYQLALGRYKSGFGINLDVLNAETALMVPDDALMSEGDRTFVEVLVNAGENPKQMAVRRPVTVG